jgi:hypothetical protein
VGGLRGAGLRQQIGAVGIFVCGNGSQEAREGADAEGGVVGDTDTLMLGM